MRCQYDGCERNDALECFLDMEQTLDGSQADLYCPEHALALGHCPMCGEFWGGIDSFEMNGLCDHCRDEIQSDADGDNDEFDEWEPEFWEE